MTRKPRSLRSLGQLWLMLSLGPLLHGPANHGAIPTVAMDPSLTVVDLHPIRNHSLHELVAWEVVQAHRRGQTPVVEVGGESCGVCHALHRSLDARPRTPHVRAAYAGMTIIRVAIEEWPDALTALGVSPEQRIPIYVAIDSSFHATRVLSIDYWTLRSLARDTVSTLRRFFTAAHRPPPSATLMLPAGRKYTERPST